MSRSGPDDGGSRASQPRELSNPSNIKMRRCGARQRKRGWKKSRLFPASCRCCLGLYRVRHISLPPLLCQRIPWGDHGHLFSWTCVSLGLVYLEREHRNPTRQGCLALEAGAYPLYRLSFPSCTEWLGLLSTVAQKHRRAISYSLRLKTITFWTFRW